jgi:copper chaperone CopZ
MNSEGVWVAELRFRVPGMSCEHCVRVVRGELDKIPGVARVSFDLDSKVVVVEGDKLEPAAVWAAVEAAGYQAEP